MAKTIANPRPESAIRRGSECMGLLLEAGLTYDDLQTPITDPEMRVRLVRAWSSGCNEPLATSPVVSPFFASEDIESTYEYPTGHHVTPVREQLMVLASSLSAVGVHLDESRILAYSKEPLVLPVGAEGAFAMPKWQKVANSYNEATELVFKALVRQRQFKNWREDKLGTKYLRPSERTEWAYQMLDQKYPGDYMIVHAQLGINWRGRSVRKVRVNYAPPEFGLGPYEVGVILLSHANRIVGDPNELYIDCPGGEYSPNGDGMFFLCTRFFYWYSEKLSFDSSGVSYPSSRYGSASAFLPQ